MLKPLADLTNGFQSKETWTKKEILSIIVKADEMWNEQFLETKNVQLYDICKVAVFNLLHPAVVFKVGEKESAVIILSTKDKEHSILPYTQRGMRSGFFTNSILIIRNEDIANSFIGVFRDKKVVKKAVKIVRKKYKEILKSDKKLKNVNKNKITGEALQALQ